MPGEPRDVLRRILGTEVVEEEKGIEPWDLRSAEGSTQVDAGALDRRAGGEDFGDLTCPRWPVVGFDCHSDLFQRNRFR
jgi:hypothetical protein